MKTLPLSEAQKRATQGKLKTGSIAHATLYDETGSHVADCAPGINRDKPNGINAALLAHWWNHGPELLEALVRAGHALTCTCDNEERKLTSPCAACAVDQAITNASTVSVQD